jgi:TPR repeat protein
MKAFRNGACILAACAGLLAAPAAWGDGREEFAVADPELRYQQGITLHRRGDERAAFRAYLEAGERGYGLAQRRLGELYDNGDGVQRDYQSSLKWYQKAREQGVPVPAPLVHSPR